MIPGNGRSATNVVLKLAGGLACRVPIHFVKFCMPGYLKRREGRLYGYPVQATPFVNVPSACCCVFVHGTLKALGRELEERHSLLPSFIIWLVQCHTGRMLLFGREHLRYRLLCRTAGSAWKKYRRTPNSVLCCADARRCAVLEKLDVCVSLASSMRHLQPLNAAQIWLFCKRPGMLNAGRFLICSSSFRQIHSLRERLRYLLRTGW